MANSRSARKRIRSSEAKHQRNRAARSAVRTQVGHARRALLGSSPVDAQEQLLAAVSALDRAAEKGILHRNNAARRKSRLATLSARLTRAGQDERATLVAAAAGGEKGKSGRSSARQGGAGGRPTTTSRSTAARKTTRK